MGRSLHAAVCFLVGVNTAHLMAADSRAEFLQLIGRPRVALAPEVKDFPAASGLTQFAFSYASDSENRVPGILLKSIYTCGTAATRTPA